MSRLERRDNPISRYGPRARLISDTVLLAKTLGMETLEQNKQKIFSRTEQLGLHFEDKELSIIAALDTPRKVQRFLNAQILYNNDHAYPGQEQTAFSPRMVLRKGKAHCFEGAMFAYMVNYLHGHNPKLVLLEASGDSDHNLVVFQNETGLWGTNAHSRYYGLDGKEPVYETIGDLVKAFQPYYYSDRTHDPKDKTLVGYSNPIDIVSKFGLSWMDSLDMLWDIYFRYIDETVNFHYLSDKPNDTSHLYPLVRAKKEGWLIRRDDGKVIVASENLPTEAGALWRQFLAVYNKEIEKIEQLIKNGTFAAGVEDKIREELKSRISPENISSIQNRFQEITGMTQLDLLEYKDEMEQQYDRLPNSPL